jgi:outer membrane protein TolC
MKALGLVFFSGFVALTIRAVEPVPAIRSSTIDLPTTLRLAGASNLDVQIAREQVAEAKAVNDSARAAYFPSIGPSVVVRRHENNIQAVNGPIIDADKNSLAAGIGLDAQLDLGEVYYQSLVTRQLVRASEAALAGREREIIYRAATAYFDLARARASVSAGEEASRIAHKHAEQSAATAEAGLLFAGDAARIRVARERSDLAVSRLRVEQRLAAARLAELLHLDPAVELVPAESELAPLTIVPADADLGPLISQALASRPELTEGAARVAAARAAQRGATIGPLIPTVGAQASVGGLGGGTGSTAPGHDFDTSNDYALGVSWRVGPGGIFDRNRQRQTAARQRQVELDLEKTRDAIRREVVEQHARLRSLVEQLELARKTLEAADQTAVLSRQRQETGVSAALEDIQAEDELAQARRDYVATVADYNQAQYALRFVTGQ